MKFYHFLLVVITVCSSCGPSFFYEKTYDLDGEIWTYSDSLDFVVDVQDTLKTYDLMLDVTHRTDYPFENSYVFIHTYLPAGEQLGKALSIDLAQKSGQWKGKCSGEQCRLRTVIQQNAYFNQQGKHRFNVQQFMRMDSLQGIASVSLRLLETGVRPVE